MKNENETLQKNDAVSLDDTINIKRIPGRFKRNFADILSEEQENISSVSEPEKLSEKKAEKTSVDDLKETASNNISAKKDESDAEIEEISIDIEDIKNEISADVEETISNALPKILSKELPDIVRSALESENKVMKLNTELSGVHTELETIKKRMQTMQISTEDGLRDNGNNTTALHKSAAEIRDRITEISKTMNNISKLSDSVFDLKNAQTNMRKVLETQGDLIFRLKKKLNVSTVVLSVLGVLIIILQIIGLLS